MGVEIELVLDSLILRQQGRAVDSQKLRLEDVGIQNIGYLKPHWMRSLREKYRK